MTFWQMIWLVRGEVTQVILFLVFAFVAYFGISMAFEKNLKTKMRVICGVIGVLVVLFLLERLPILDRAWANISHYYNLWSLGIL